MADTAALLVVDEGAAGGADPRVGAERAVPYVILAGLATDLAPFWAPMIGLLKYIPYVGSYIAVVMPVMVTRPGLCCSPCCLSPCRC
mgnify:CR=1 FL=1